MKVALFAHGENQLYPVFRFKGNMINMYTLPFSFLTAFDANQVVTLLPTKLSPSKFLKLLMFRQQLKQASTLLTACGLLRIVLAHMADIMPMKIMNYIKCLN